MENTTFGLTDIIVAMVDKANESKCSHGILELIEEDHHDDHSPLSDSVGLFSTEDDLRRSFTVRCSKDGPSELLTIDRRVLFEMKTEFRKHFVEFFQGGVGELEKAIHVKMYAMGHCERRYKEWASSCGHFHEQYDVKVITNK